MDGNVRSNKRASNRRHPVYRSDRKNEIPPHRISHHNIHPHASLNVSANFSVSGYSNYVKNGRTSRGSFDRSILASVDAREEQFVSFNRLVETLDLLCEIDVWNKIGQNGFRSGYYSF